MKKIQINNRKKQKQIKKPKQIINRKSLNHDII